MWSYADTDNWDTVEQWEDWVTEDQYKTLQYHEEDKWSQGEHVLRTLFKYTEPEKDKDGSRFRPLDDEKIAALEDELAEKRTGRKGIFRTVIDSGASENVLPASHGLVDKDTLADSPKKGTKYASATGATTTNQGQIRLNLWEGRKASLSYQVTQVSQSLTSVAKL